MTTIDLGQKFLMFLIHEVLKSGASSGLGKFRRKVMGQSSSEHIEVEAPTAVASVPSPRSIGSGSKDSFIGRHLRRPMGAEAILGNKHVKPKGKKSSFGKKL